MTSVNEKTTSETNDEDLCSNNEHDHGNRMEPRLNLEAEAVNEVTNTRNQRSSQFPSCIQETRPVSWLGSGEEKVASPLLTREENCLRGGGEDVTIPPLLCQSAQHSANYIVPVETETHPHPETRMQTFAPSVISWNIQGLRTGRPEIKVINNERQPLVYCLQETMCSTEEQAHIRGFSTFHRMRTGGRRASGGVLTAVKAGIDCHEINVNSVIEAVAVMVGHPLNTNILNVYIPPGKPVEESDIVSLINQVPAPLIVVGDVNASHPLWGAAISNNRGRVIEAALNECQLAILNNGEATHVHHANGTMSSIDIACCSNDLAGSLSFDVLADSHGSDHFPLVVTFPDTGQSLQRRTNWKIDEADWQLYQNTVHFKTAPNVEDQIEEITKAILKAAEISIPKTKGTKHGKTPVPWWNHEVAEAIRNRRKALRNLKSSSKKHTNKEELLKKFQEARGIARKTIASAQQKSWQNFVNGFSVNTPTKEMWTNFQRVQGKRVNSRVYAMKVDGKTVTEDAEIAETLAKAFQSVSSNSSYSKDFQTYKEMKENQPIQYPECFEAEYNNPFSVYELEHALEGLKGSTPGEDQIHYRMISMLPYDCKMILLKAYNQLWEESKYPDGWRHSTVVPIYKGKGERSNPDNYRPIFLNSCLGKVMERLINNRLMHILESRKLISSHQYAFRKGRTTVDHLTEMEKIIREAFVKHEYAYAVFLDVSKAYDTTWRRLVLNKLCEWKIGGKLLLFLETMLQKRCFKVLANGHLSTEKLMETGLCQGSVLSVTLFLIAIDTITSNLPCSIRILLYADDVVILATGNNSAVVNNQLQHALAKVQEWQGETGFKISPGKSALVIFRKKRMRKPKTKPILVLNNQTIPEKKYHKCLGVTFDETLKFDEHVEEIKAACQQRIQILRAVAGRSWGADRATLIKLYRATTVEKLLYAAPIVSASNSKTIKKLETVHNTGLRIICGAFRTSPISSLQVETGIPSFENLLRQRTALHSVKKTCEHPAGAVDSEGQIEVSSNYSSSSDESSGEIWGENVAEVELAETAELRGMRIIDDLQLDVPPVEHYTVPNIPPWNMIKIPLDKRMLEASREGLQQAAMRNLFSSIRSTKYRIYKSIYTDGSKRENACSYSVVCEANVIRKRIYGNSSIYAAECAALKEAFQWIIDNEQLGAYLICTDSLSAVSKLEKYKLKSKWQEDMLQLYRRIRENGSDVQIMWLPSHIGIAGNEKADYEAKRALDDPYVTVTPVDLNEIKTIVKNQFINRWQALWSTTRDNKLREVKPSVRPFTSAFIGNRKDDIVLARLRIGHTKITHQYLMEKEQPPRCQHCNAPLSVKHFMTDCPVLEEERDRADISTNLQDVLEDNLDKAKKVIEYLKKIDMYDKI